MRLQIIILTLATLMRMNEDVFGQPLTSSGTTMSNIVTPTSWSDLKKVRTINGQKLAYVEIGQGQPIVFLHGNPTSSFIWRNIVPFTEKLGRCIAPDLIGMGDSDKLPNTNASSYSFKEHANYLDAFLEQMEVRNDVIFVAHDWGAALAFDWARRHPGAVKGIAYMEAILGPMSFKDMPEAAQNIFRALRTQAGEEMVLEQNSFIEINLPNTILRKLTPEEMDNYRKPFLTAGESRRVMLSWARQLPFDGKPEDVADIVRENMSWVSSSRVPKLFIESVPGTMSPAMRDVCGHFPTQVKISVKGHHHLQEDSPVEIGVALATWVQSIDMGK